MKHFYTIVIITAAFLSCIFAKAQSELPAPCNQDFFTDTLLDHLVGHWQAKGQVMGDLVVYDYHAEWVLNHQFLKMTFADTATVPQYTAEVFIGFDCAKNQYVVHWIDNFGGPFSETIGHGSANGSSISLNFAYPSGAFNNTYTYLSEHHQWTSISTYLDEQNNVQTFASITLYKLD